MNYVKIFRLKHTLWLPSKYQNARELMKTFWIAKIRQYSHSPSTSKALKSSRALFPGSNFLQVDRFVETSEKVAQSKIIERSSGCIWSDGYPSSGDLCLPSNLCNSSNQKSTVAISSQDSVFGFSWSSLAVLRCRQHNCHNINLTPSSDQQTLACHTCSLISSQDSVFGFSAFRVITCFTLLPAP